VVYSRIYHDPSDSRLGVERQEQDCLRLITRRGWDLTRPPYRENDISASTRSATKRPARPPTGSASDTSECRRAAFDDSAGPARDPPMCV
jgi:hypothetical protein